MTLNPANELFSHPETHDSHAKPGSPDPEQRSRKDLFQEPAPAPQSTQKTA
jgi:hypothetical protein